MAPIRLLIFSDTHDTAFPSWDSLQDKFPFENNKIDILIHCGDLTMIGGLSNYRRAISSILSIPAELRLVIPGNHDVSLDPKWWSENLIEEEDDPAELEKALDLFANAKNDGLELLNEGIHAFTLKDGRKVRIYASPYTPEFGGYAFAYGPEEDRFNDGSGRVPDREDMGVDIVMTHGPPTIPFPSSDAQKEVGQSTAYKLDLGRQGEHCGCDKLFKAVDRARPLIHCFGHIHEGHGAQVLDWETREVSDAVVSSSSAPGVEAAGGEGGKGDENKLPVINVGTGERGKKTAFVNAAIMRHGEESGNQPWIVELEV